MNKEEIINIIEKVLSNKEIGLIVATDTFYQAIQGLLDLYNKEKEKREIAEENHKVLSLDLGKALRELGLYEDTIISDELVLEINKKYISKDKIKEKIEECKINLEHIKNGEEFENEYEMYYWWKIALEELLEE